MDLGYWSLKASHFPKESSFGAYRRENAVVIHGQEYVGR